MDILIESIISLEHERITQNKEKNFYGELLFEVLQNKEYRNIRSCKQNVNCVIRLYPEFSNLKNFIPSHLKSLQKSNMLPEIINNENDMFLYNKKEIYKFFNNNEEELDDFCKIS